jgi:DNA-directed RNA polymerase specialized sigma24 family protein
MKSRSKCDCLVCHLEASLFAELSYEQGREQFRLLAASSQTLSTFSTAVDLVEHLHNGHQHNSLSDPVLLDLVARTAEPAFCPIAHALLLLVFVPTIHRTNSQIVATFPSLARDDTAQCLFAALLEFLRSKELQSRGSHIAFTIARKIRRSGFRWAIRESRKSLRNEAGETQEAPSQAEIGLSDSHSYVLLEQFLDRCQRNGWISSEERDLLIQFKLERISGSELARRAGISVVAIRHRIQRVLGRLRRIARQQYLAQPEQLELFPRADRDARKKFRP